MNELHLFALHFVYLQRINRSISLFQNARNHHSLCTMQNASPHQLYTAGILRLQQSNLSAFDFIDSSYGIDKEIMTEDTAETAVSIPETWLNLSGVYVGYIHNNRI